MNSIEVINRESLDDVGRLPDEKATEDLDRVEINGNPDRFFMVGAFLNQADRQQLISFLLGNLDVFAWTPYEMPGVDPSVSQHRLNVDPTCKPIIHKSRRSVAEHTAAVVDEVDRLLDARAIREVTYPTWLSNTMVVKKKNELFLLRLCLIHGLSSEELEVSDRPFFLGSGDNESESLSVSYCRLEIVDHLPSQVVPDLSVQLV